MSNFDVSILLRLVDRLTGPARQAAQSMRALGQGVRAAASTVQSSARGMERPFTAALDRMGRKAREFAIRMRKAFADIASGPGSRLNEIGGKLNAMRWQMMGTLFFAAPAVLPFKRLADAELELTKIGQISQWKPEEFGQNLVRMNDTLRGVADETRQSFTTIAQGMNFLVASGLSENDSVKGIRSIGKAATATHADIEDLSKMAYALRQNLGIKPEQWEEAFGVAHLGGKLGAFELKDAARWFPELTTDMRFLGQTGLTAVEDLTAFLQIVRQGAGTSDIAANNLANVFQKIFTKETAKNFKKYAGIDFKKEMMGARDRGENPLFKLLELIDKYSKGEAFQIGDLFVDRQALNAIKILIAKRDELKKMQADIHAGGGQAQIDADFASSLKTLTYQARSLFIALDKFMNTSFSQVLGETKSVIGVLTSFVEKMNDFAKTFPKLTGSAMLGIGGLVAAALAIRLTIFTAMSLRAALLGVAIAGRASWSVFAALWRVLAGPGIAVNLGKLAASMRAFAGALVAVGLIGRLALLRTALMRLGGAIVGVAFGPIGLIAGLLLAMVPDEWWTTAIGKLREGFAIIGGYISSWAAQVKGWMTSIFDAFNSAAASVGQALNDTLGKLQLPSGPLMLNPNLRPGQTIPGIANQAMPQMQNDNRTINNAVTVPITINATVNNTTPQGIAGAVQGAGQSVAGEVKKALSDGGQ